MAQENPSKSDIQTIFKRLRSIAANKQCFDCRAMNPTWASVTYGVFLCIDCSALHRSLGVHVTFIRSTQLDTNWTWLQLRAMQVGGNSAANAFFKNYGCTSSDAQQKYHSKAAKIYREKLHSQALKAMKQYGTKTHIHLGDPTSPSPDAGDVDFFKEHVEKAEEFLEFKEEKISSDYSSAGSEPVPIANGSLSQKQTVIEDTSGAGEGPSVDAALSISPTEAIQKAEARKPTIGARKPTSAKKGLGTRNRLGAQRVKTNFSDIESAANKKDQDRELLQANALVEEARNKEEADKNLAAMKLAYQDLSLEEKKRGDKMKHMEPKKAAQLERLGMGFNAASSSRVISHSALTDMETIEQETPTQSSNNTFDRYSASRGRSRDPDDDWEVIGGFSSGPPKYDNPFGLKREDKYSTWGNSGKSNWDTSDRFDSKQSSLLDDISASKDKEDKSRSRKNYEVSSSDDAQKKFGNAKSISSDQFFGNKDMDFEMKQNLTRLEGKSGISSADLFGEDSQRGGSSSYYGSGPDLTDIREGVRDGVTKVAGKLSKLANGMMSSIQDHYG